MRADCQRAMWGRNQVDDAVFCEMGSDREGRFRGHKGKVTESVL